MVNIFNKLDNYIFVITKDRKIKFLNEAILKKMNLEKDEIDNINIIDNLKLGDNNNINFLLDSLDKYKEIEFDFWFNFRDREVCLNGCLLEGDFEGEKSFFIIAKDFVEKYYTREDLEHLLDSLDTGCFIKKVEGEYVYINKKICDFSDEDKYNILGSRNKDIFIFDNNQDLLRDEKKIKTPNKIFFREKKINKDRRSKWFETKLHTIQKKDKELYILGSVKNISMKRELDKTLDNIAIQFQKINSVSDKERFERNYNFLFKYMSQKTADYFNADGVAILKYDENYKQYNVLAKEGIITDDLVKDVKTKFYEYIAQNPFKREVINHTEDIHDNIELRKILEKKKIYAFIIHNIVLQKKIIGNIVVTFSDKSISKNSGFDYLKTICVYLAFSIGNLEGARKFRNEIYKYKQQKRILENYINICTDIIGMCTIDGDLQSINYLQVEEILGWNEEDLKNNKIYTFFNKEEQKYMHKEFEKGLKSYKDIVINRQSKFACKDNTYKWLEWNLRYHKKEGIIFFTAVDITYKKQLEEKQKKLEEAMKMESLKNEFIINISHEFRTPINVVLTTIQLIEKYMNSKENSDMYLKKHMSVIKRNSYRLYRLIENIVDLSKIQANMYDVNFGDFDIVNLVESISMSVANYLKKYGVNLIFDTNCEEKIISCDPEKIERIVLNLLSNAIKYNKNNNDIEVYVNVEENSVKISIKDYGIGISEEEKNIIFNKFIKLDNQLTRLSEGSGIGLSIANEFIKIHGGNINVESKIGEGSIFEFEIPIIKRQHKSGVEDKKYQYIDDKIEKFKIEFSDIYH